MLIKFCGGCQETKNISLFNKNKNKADGLATQCKSCSKAYRDANKDSLNAYRKSYYDADPTRGRELRIQRWREYGRDKQYGLQPGTINKMIFIQNDRCANPGCNTLITWETSHVDHDHLCCPGKESCGECVRGILCTKCNVALGFLQDDFERIRGLADYARQVAKEEV